MLEITFAPHKFTVIDVTTINIFTFYDVELDVCRASLALSDASMQVHVRSNTV